MIRYRGFSFPADLPLLATVIWNLIIYAVIIRTKSPRDLMIWLTRPISKPRRCASPKNFIRLEKMYRLISFLLLRQLQYSRPCLIRSSILFRQARRFGLDAAIFIGVKHSGSALEGHSWITLAGRPFREDPRILDEYTIMMRS